MAERQKVNFPLRETQEILSLNNAILIEHLSTNDRLQTVVISPNKAHYIDMPEDDKFKSLLNTYIAGISDPNNTSWRSTSKALYQLLLQPIFNKIDMSNISRLLIASDSDLQGLPFETLLNEQDQFLVDNFSIDYISSMTALDQQMRWTQTISNQNMAVYTNENTTDAAAAGVTEIVKICKGTLMTGQDANSVAFTQNAGQYNIVHVAIQGYFDVDEPQNSGLIFDDSAMEKDIVSVQ